MRWIKTEGIVIKRVNFGEADRLLTIFTKTLGKVQIKAAGVRRINSRRAGHIELLNQCKFGLYKGRGMFVLTEVESIRNFEEIKEDLTKVGFAYHICELVDGLCAEEQENIEVYNLLKETLGRLDGNEDLVPVIHEFEIELLTRLGFYKAPVPEDFDTSSFIEQILERKLKSKRILKRFT